jgi:hypothetical protein
MIYAQGKSITFLPFYVQNMTGISAIFRFTGLPVDRGPLTGYPFCNILL